MAPSDKHWSLISINSAFCHPLFLNFKAYKTSKLDSYVKSNIYKSNILKDSNSEPENLGAPFNSGADDFAMFIDSDTETGYFSSNREGGKGNDDIYGFSAYECQQLVKGIVRDKETLEPLANANVELIDEAGKIVNNITTNENGEYSFEVECEKNYSVRGSKPDFEDDVQTKKN